MIDPFEWQECGLSRHATPLAPTHRLLRGTKFARCAASRSPSSATTFGEIIPT
jgi:hypothetical protein